jgi:hypothetical protein
MKIILKINNDNKIILSLFEGKKEKGSLEWREDNSLSRVLLAKIDEILRKNIADVDPAPISLSKKDRLLHGSAKMANHGAGHKDWAICPTRGGRYPQRNWCGVDKISEYKIISDVPQKWTSVRIAKITFETLGIARKK